MKIGNFYKKLILNFFEFWSNIFIFLPYFFSVSQLLKTFFYPWKNLIIEKKEQGFSLSQWLERHFTNLISRVIGAIMRFSLLSFYFLLQLLMIIFLPLSFFLLLIFSPFLLILEMIKPDEIKEKIILKKRFIENHLLNEENLSLVEDWFEKYYTDLILKKKWWKLKNLLSYPPLARDWSYGYTYYLNQYSQDLTSPEYLNKLTPFFDREEEIDLIEETLSKSYESNIILIGEEGVGKHAVVDALASRIYSGTCHPKLAYHRILKLNMEKILSQHNDSKQREIFFENLMLEAYQAKNVMIFIDNIERYLSSSRLGFFDLSTIIEKFARHSELQFIGITTPFLFESFIQPNERINRLFSKIYVKEVDKNVAISILLNLVPSFEKKYSTVIPYETVKTIIDKSSFFFTEIPFPEKAINLLDEICSYAQFKKIKQILPETVDFVITQKTHIPTTLTTNLKNKLINCEQYLKQNIVLQDEAIKQLSTTLQTAFLLYGKRKKPLASFLFLGPTGVGKTETAKLLANYFFETDNALIRFDMSLYQSKNDITKLIGDSTANIPGLLTQSIKEKPYSVLLLDEIEKANPQLLNIFLTILDEGYFTDGTGKKVNCQNLIIIATSNAGANQIYKKIHDEGLNFSWTVFEKEILQFVISHKIFTPEFINRFDGVAVYKALNYRGIKYVAEKMLNKVLKDVYGIYGVRAKINSSYLDKLINEIYTPEFGARQMERIIRQNIESQIARYILTDRTDKKNELLLS
jgi:ATP-dependent Clp protease ATP-binding subunit ClpC